MTANDVTSHFWVAGQPFFTSTLLVAPALSSIVTQPGNGNSVDSSTVMDGRSVTILELYDVDGCKTNSVEVEFPSNEIGIIELEPFLGGVKIEGGVQHGHLAVSSPSGTRHVCRLANHAGASLVQDPLQVRARESCFIPLTLASQKEQMLALVNAGSEVAQVSCRLFYGNRSPEWNLVVSPFGTKLIPLHEELLASQDDRSWEKSPVQAYIRIGSRHQSSVSCLVIERVPGDSLEQDQYRCLVSW